MLGSNLYLFNSGFASKTDVEVLQTSGTSVFRTSALAAPAFGASKSDEPTFGTSTLFAATFGTSTLGSPRSGLEISGAFAT